jgi:hypothetical protein
MGVHCRAELCIFIYYTHTHTHTHTLIHTLIHRNLSPEQRDTELVKLRAMLQHVSASVGMGDKVPPPQTMSMA